MNRLRIPSSRPTALRAALSAAAVAALTFSGCKGEENTCDFWMKQLNKTKKEKQAIEKMGELGCQAAIPTLEKMWDETLYQRELLQSVKQLGASDGTLTIVKKALEDADYGPVALTIAIDWKVSGLDATLSALLRSPKMLDLRRDALNALIRLGFAETSVDTLWWLAGQDPAQQGIEVNQKAAEELARIDWSKQPEDVSKTAAQMLLRTLLMRDAKGVTAQAAARNALRAIGPHAVEPVLKAFRGDDSELDEFAESRGIPRWKYTHGHELVELLWDLGDARASKPLAGSIGMSLDAPPDVARLDESQQEDWIIANQKRLATTSVAVGALPSEDAVSAAVEILSRKGIPLDPAQFSNAGLALALQGTKSAREQLWALFREGDADLLPKRTRLYELKAMVAQEKDKEKRAPLASEHDKLLDELEKAEVSKAKWVMNLSVSLGPGDAESFKAEVTDLQKGPLSTAGKAALPAGYAAAVAECNADASCYLKILTAAQGTLTTIPVTITKAGEEKEVEYKRLIEEAKPITADIAAKEDELTKKSEALTQMRTDFDESKKSNTKLKELGHKSLQDFADIYNAELEAYDLGKDALKKLYESRNAVIDKLIPFDERLVASQAALHKLEKAVLMLAHFPEVRAEAVAAITALNKEARGLPKEQAGFFQQLRQWSMITLDRITTKDDLQAIEDVRAIEGKDGQTYFSIRLDAIAIRLRRAAGVPLQPPTKAAADAPAADPVPK